MSGLGPAVLVLGLMALPGEAGEAGAQEPQAYPPITEIVFAGNEVTQPRTMLREMTIHVGAPADPLEIERSRQGVQDLGLFRSVQARQEPMADGVRLVITVKEKYYILPVPRADYSSDGGYGYGGQLRWDNVWGLNHTFNPFFERRQPSEGSADAEVRGIQTRSQLRYQAPFIFDTDFSASFNAGYTRTPYLRPIRYDDTVKFVSFGLSRKLTGGRRSQGWTGSTGLTWQEERTFGALAPLERGQAVSLGLGATYRDLHFNVYSDEGVAWGGSVTGATESVLSDYDFTVWNLTWARYLAIGRTPHQNLNLELNVVGRHDGTFGGDAYSIGGTSTIRGFEPETRKGDAYYNASIEYLRPVFRNSIRLLVVLDAANAFPSPQEFNLDKVFVSAGLGVRVRIQAFVALDLEIGLAWPLNGGEPRVFASKV